jgi:hypothetical protein
MKGRKGEKHERKYCREWRDNTSGPAKKEHNRFGVEKRTRTQTWPTSSSHLRGPSHTPYKTFPISSFFLPSIFIYSKSDAILFRQFILLIFINFETNRNN